MGNGAVPGLWRNWFRAAPEARRYEQHARRSRSSTSMPTRKVGQCSRATAPRCSATRQETDTTAEYSDDEGNPGAGSLKVTVPFDGARRSRSASRSTGLDGETLGLHGQEALLQGDARIRPHRRRDEPGWSAGFRQGWPDWTWAAGTWKKRRRRRDGHMAHPDHLSLRTPRKGNEGYLRHRYASDRPSDQHGWPGGGVHDRGRLHRHRYRPVIRSVQSRGRGSEIMRVDFRDAVGCVPTHCWRPSSRLADSNEPGSRRSARARLRAPPPPLEAAARRARVPVSEARARVSGGTTATGSGGSTSAGGSSATGAGGIQRRDRRRCGRHGWLGRRRGTALLVHLRR